MDAVLFDLDGTLWDACDTLTAAWNGILAAKFPHLHRTLTLADLQGVMGKTLPEIARLFFPHLPFEQACEVVATVCADEVAVLGQQGGTLYDGVPEVLRELHATRRVGIVSNCQCGYIEAFLQAHDLADCVDGFLCEGMTHKSKGENIRQLAARLGVEKSVYVGDTRSDEDAARAAGVPFIHAAYGFGDAASPDATIHSFHELPPLLTKWGI